MVKTEKRTLSLEARLRDNLSKPIGTMERALTRFTLAGVSGFRRVVGAVTGLRAKVIGLVGAYVGLRGIGLVKEFAEEADVLVKTARATGDLVENLSELSAAFSLAGGDERKFRNALKQLGIATKQAVDGNATVVRTFQELGITLEDLQRLGPSQVFERLAAGLEQYSTEQEKALKLSRIFPELFQRLLPLVGSGLEGFQKAIRDVRDVGATVTLAQAEEAEKLNDAWSKVGIAIGSVGRALIETFGPATTAILETFAANVSRNRDAIVQFAKVIGGVFTKAIDLATEAIISLIGYVEQIPGLNLLGDLGGQKAELERELLGVRAIIRQGLDFTDEAKAREKELVRQMEKLGRAAAGGLAGELRRQKAQLVDDLARISGQIAGNLAPTTNDDTARVLGMPTEDQVRTYSEALRRSLGELPQAQGPGADSVFRQTPGQAATLSPDTVTESTSTDRERLAIMQQLAGLASDLVPFQDALRDIEQRSAILQLQEARDKGVINAEELAQAIAFVNEQFARTKQLIGGGDFFTGFSRGARDALRSWTDFTAAGREAAATLVTGGLDGLTDAFVSIIDGTKSAKEAFKDYAKQLLADIARIIVKLTIMRALQSVFGLEDGGVVQKFELGGIRQFATGGLNRNGGVATSPTVLFGEGRNNEAFVPLPDNRTIPVTINGGAGMGGNTVVFNITAMDSRDVQRVLYEQQGTLRSIFTNQAENRSGMRQVLRRAVS